MAASMMLWPAGNDLHPACLGNKHVAEAAPMAGPGGCLCLWLFVVASSHSGLLISERSCASLDDLHLAGFGLQAGSMSFLERDVCFFLIVEKLSPAKLICMSAVHSSFKLKEAFCANRIRTQMNEAMVNYGESDPDVAHRLLVAMTAALDDERWEV